MLPEIVYRKLENLRSVLQLPETANEDKPVWCLCQQPEYEKMINCHGYNCPFTKFHYQMCQYMQETKTFGIAPVAWICKISKIKYELLIKANNSTLYYILLYLYV